MPWKNKVGKIRRSKLYHIHYSRKKKIILVTKVVKFGQSLPRDIKENIQSRRTYLLPYLLTYFLTRISHAALVKEGYMLSWKKVKI